MKLNDANKHFFILGDININTSPRRISSSGSDYINMLLSCGIASVIDKPIRIMPSWATILDHILTNEDRFTIVPGVIEHDLTDHYPVMVSISNKMDKNKYCSNAKFTRDLSTFSVDSFNEDLQIKLDYFMLKIPCATATNINSMFEDFYSLITTTIENHAPLKKLTRKQTRLRNKPWITKGLLKSINRKQKMHKTYCINGSTDERKFYKSYCNTQTRIKTLAKKLFYKTQFDVHKHDPKKAWDTLRTLLPAKPKAQTPTSLSVNSMSLSDPILIAEALNEHFARIGKTLINKFNVDHDNAHPFYLKHSCPSSLYLYPTTPAEIFRLITLLKINKANGHDDIPPYFLRIAVNTLALPLSSILNQFLLLGIFPDKLKIAKVVPVYKNGSSDQLGNYRPISLLTSLSKIFERIIFNRMTFFLKRNNTITPT